MGKFMIPSVLVIVLLVLFLGYFFVFDQRDSSLDSNSSDSGLETNSPNSGVEDYYYDSLTTNFPDCDALDADYKKEDCYSQKAIDAADSSICDYIKPSESRTSSYISTNTLADCYSGVALKIEDASLCEKITATQSWQIRDDCFLGLSSSFLSDDFYCENIQTQYIKNTCYFRF